MREIMVSVALVVASWAVPVAITSAIWWWLA